MSKKSFLTFHIKSALSKSIGFTRLSKPKSKVGIILSSNTNFSTFNTPAFAQASGFTIPDSIIPDFVILGLAIQGFAQALGSFMSITKDS